jgi:hypothetical protein
MVSRAVSWNSRTICSRSTAARSVSSPPAASPRVQESYGNRGASVKRRAIGGYGLASPPSNLPGCLAGPDRDAAARQVPGTLEDEGRRQHREEHRTAHRRSVTVAAAKGKVNRALRSVPSIHGRPWDQKSAENSRSGPPSSNGTETYAKAYVEQTSLLRPRRQSEEPC